MGAVCDCSITCTDYMRRNSLIENENMEQVRQQKWEHQQDQYDIASGSSSVTTNSSDGISRNESVNKLLSLDDETCETAEIRENIAEMITERESQKDVMRTSPSINWSSPSSSFLNISPSATHRSTLHLKDEKINLSIFEQIEKDSDDTHSIGDCRAFERIVMSLIYYSSLDPEHRSRDRKQFEEFMMNKYSGFLNDYVHLMQCHGNELNEEQLLFSCDQSIRLDVQSWYYIASSYIW